MKLFKKLAAVYSGSHAEEPMRQYIKRWVRSSVPNVTIEEDAVGNLYLTKGQAETYPCLAAHMDQVQQPYPKDYKVVETADIVFGYSPSQRRQCGLGADDKCGIWIALKMLKQHEVLKVAFFIAEEVGCKGSSQANMEFFSDVRFVVQADRRGAHDLITDIGFCDICSEDFVIATEAELFGYKEETGMMTDVEALKENGLGVSCINLSCGYYDPHTEREYVVKQDMINALNFVNHIIEKCVDVYPHEFSQYDRYADYYSYYGRGKWRKKNGEELEEAKLEEFYEQYATARDYLSFEIDQNPNLSAQEFITSYGQTLNLLRVEDIEDIIAELQDESLYDDGYDWNNQLSSHSIQTTKNNGQIK